MAAWAFATLALILYFAAFATDRYVAEARFTVRSASGTAALPAGDPVSAHTGLQSTVNAAAAWQDAFLLRDYVGSQELVDKLDGQLDLKRIFGGAGPDILSRLPASASREDMRDYWRSRVTTDLDLTTGLVRLRVQTFSPDVTLKVTRAILADCEALINRLSEQARRDAVRFAEEDVRSAEQRLKAARLAITHFRNQHGVIDPMKTAEANLALIAKLEADAVQAQAQVLAADLDRQSPTRRNAEASISALKQQIATLRRELAAQSPDSEAPSATRPLSSLVTEYQELELEREFADRHYLKSLSALEAARQDAARTQRYLVVYVQPRLPDEPLEPRRLWAILGIVAGSLALAAMTAIAWKTVREHVG